MNSMPVFLFSQAANKGTRHRRAATAALRTGILFALRSSP